MSRKEININQRKILKRNYNNFKGLKNNLNQYKMKINS